MTLKELYDRKEDVRESELPEGWRKSFNKFISNQTCMRDAKNDDWIYFYEDYALWYIMNKKNIERDDKIDNVIN